MTPQLCEEQETIRDHRRHRRQTLDVAPAAIEINDARRRCGYCIERRSQYLTGDAFSASPPGRGQFRPARRRRELE